MLLSRHGVLYMVLVPENDLAEIAAILAPFGFTSKTVLERRAGRERLFIVKYWRP